METENPEELGLVGDKAEAFGRMIEAYQRSPVLRMLVKMIPPLGIAEAGILGTYAYFQHRRLQVFAEKFTTLGLTISERDAKRREFFDAYTSTARRVLAESRDEKIRQFALLFAQFLKGDCRTPIDLYEEHLSVLEELSEREFRLLLLLQRHESANPRQASENPLQRAQRFWPAFVQDAQGELGIPGSQLEAILDRLTRTGLYQTVVGAFTDYTGGRGYLTPNFEAFLNALGIVIAGDESA